MLTERNLNIPHKAKTHTKSSQKSPQSYSKLPRRVPTPNSAPATIQWTSRFSDRIPSTAASHSPCEDKSIGFPQSANQKATKATPGSTDKPLPQEKPLPSRPVARLSNVLSPSKDSRTLVDASERPLHVSSISGETHEWPSLRPRLSQPRSLTPALGYNDANQSYEDSTASTYATPSSTMATSPEPSTATSVKTLSSRTINRRVSQSPTSSYASATENTAPATVSRRLSFDANERLDRAVGIERRVGSIGNASADEDLPARKESLRKRISSGSLIVPPTGSKCQLTGFTDFTRLEATSPTIAESRPHSPSPASFSRPRPGSSSTGSMKTASRIPIPDSKKATIVDLKKDQPFAPPMPRATGLPTFGSRRLVSPDALKILENGKIRRQMQRTATGASSAPHAEGPLTQDSEAMTAQTPSLSHSLDSSPNDTPTVDTDTSDVESSPPSCGPQHVPKIPNRSSRRISSSSQQSDLARDMFYDNMAATASVPPQTSPFAAPLPSIPSEAVLSMHSVKSSDETGDHLVRTLSRLEGEGTPPKFDVDNTTLVQMFGHMRKGLQRRSSDSTALLQNVAAAEKFLAQRQSTAATLQQREGESQNSAAVTGLSDDASNRRPASAAVTKEKKQTVLSKWSNSTPSEKALSAPSDGIISDLQEQSTVKSEETGPSAEESFRAPVSIGYPSLISAKVNRLNEKSTDDAATVASIPSRRSSPTLGKRRPRPERIAREGLQVVNASFARTTASVDSRKSSKLPSPNTKAFSNPEYSQRGRNISSGYSRTRSEPSKASKLPRSQSKSRFVLDKINGLFSGRREKTKQAAPPVPRIQERTVNARPDEGLANGTTTMKAARTPQLAKMPSLSPSSQTGLRTPSRVTIHTDDTTLVDSISMKDETQCVQVLSEHLVGKARNEMDPQRRQRLLTFAKVLHDSLISVREAAISAETAQHAAKSAQISYEMTQKSLAMIQRLATSVARTSSYDRR